MGYAFWVIYFLIEGPIGNSKYGKRIDLAYKSCKYLCGFCIKLLYT